MKVISITPVFNETKEQIERFWEGLEEVRKALKRMGVWFQPYFLDDKGNNPILAGLPVLVNHPENQGLARTLQDGYEMALAEAPAADLIIRLDSNEHDPMLIVEAVKAFLYSDDLQALFVPVHYWVNGQPRLSHLGVYGELIEFGMGLRSPIQEGTISRLYNQVFPLGFQAFSRPALQKILFYIQSAMLLFEQTYQVKPTWGLDLVTLLLIAKHFPSDFDFMFGGWARPWQENRPAEKIAEQRKRAEMWLEVFEKLQSQQS